MKNPCVHDGISFEEHPLGLLKEEIRRRAQIKKTPFRAPLRLEDITTFIERLSSTDRDHWAAEWSRIAEPYEKMGDDLLDAGKRHEASDA